MRLTDKAFEKFAQVMESAAGKIDSEQLGVNSYYVTQKEIHKEIGLSIAE